MVTTSPLRSGPHVHATSELTARVTAQAESAVTKMDMGDVPIVGHVEICQRASSDLCENEVVGWAAEFLASAEALYGM